MSKHDSCSFISRAIVRKSNFFDIIVPADVRDEVRDNSLDLLVFAPETTPACADLLAASPYASALLTKQLC